MQNSNTVNFLYAASFISNTTGVSVGNAGAMVKTINGGINWVFNQVSPNEILYSIDFADANNAYAVGNNGTIVKTTNGGTSWEAQSSGTTKILRSVYFSDINNGYIVGETGTILKTTNGGALFNSDNIRSETGINIFPNPANNKIIISIPDIEKKEKILNIFTMHVDLVVTCNIHHSNNIEIDLSNLPKGIYLVKVESEKEYDIRKLVIQ